MGTLRFFLLALAVLAASIAESQVRPFIFNPNPADTANARKGRGGLLQAVIEKAVANKGGGMGLGLGSDEIAMGLKEALSVGAENSSRKLSALDGFFGNAIIRLLLPPEAVKVEQKLRGIGLGRQVDNAILAINRAAEDAAGFAAPIFINTIKGITIADAIGILRGGDTAATVYLKQRTVTSLSDAFRPVIDRSLKKVDATRYWNIIFTTYNNFSREKVNPDLVGYVTERALSGIFYQVGEEEKRIRREPIARTTELLRKVFGGNRN